MALASLNRCFVLIISVLLLVSYSLCSSVFNKSVEVNLVDPLENPCFGRRDGFARDLSDCQRYFQCESGNAYLGSCDEFQVFDAETEMCVSSSEADRVCFRCPSNQYELISVPNACRQFIQCLRGIPTLRACNIGLVFDGQAGVHQCNKEVTPGFCFRESPTDIALQSCPPVYDQPIFYLDINLPGS